MSNNLSANGDGTVDGIGGTDVQTYGVFNVNDGSSVDPSGFNALYVGNNQGVSGNVEFPNYRSILTFDLSNLPAAPAGFAYQVTGINLILEIAGGNNPPVGAVRPATIISVFAGSAPAGSDSLGNFLGSRTYDGPDQSFASVGLNTSDLDLNTDTSFTVTLNADGIDESGGNFLANGWYTFGSGLNSVGNPDASLVFKSPQLDIEFELVPEPSSAMFCVFGGLVFLSRRNRK